MLEPRLKFQLAHTIGLGLLEAESLHEPILEGHELKYEETRKLIKIHLANYFAGALLLPYDCFSRKSSARVTTSNASHSSLRPAMRRWRTESATSVIRCGVACRCTFFVSTSPETSPSAIAAMGCVFRITTAAARRWLCTLRS